MANWVSSPCEIAGEFHQLQGKLARWNPGRIWRGKFLGESGQANPFNIQIFQLMCPCAHHTKNVIMHTHKCWCVYFKRFSTFLSLIAYIGLVYLSIFYSEGRPLQFRLILSLITCLSCLMIVYKANNLWWLNLLFCLGPSLWWWFIGREQILLILPNLPLFMKTNLVKTYFGHASNRIASINQPINFNIISLSTSVISTSYQTLPSLTDY